LRFGSVTAVWPVAVLALDDFVQDLPRLGAWGRTSMSGLGADRWAATIKDNVASARTWIAARLPRGYASHWLRVAGVLITTLAAGACLNPAEARSARKEPPKRVIHGPNYQPPYAAIVVDDKSGFVLHEASADEPRHPAS